MVETSQQARARARRELAKRTAERTARLQSVTAALSQSLTYDQVADVIITQGVAALDASIGLVATLSEDGTTFHALRLVGYPPDVVQAWREFPFDALVALADAVRRGAPVVLESLEERDARYPNWTVIAGPGADGAVVCLPLRVGERTIGAMSLSFPTARHFRARDRAFMRALGDLCAQALDRARLYDEEQRARVEAEAAVRMRDDILSIATHDLRSPLTNLVGRAQMIEHRLRGGAELDRSWLAAQVQAVRQATAQMSAIIEEMSDVAHLRMGEALTLHIEEVDVGALTRTVVGGFETTNGAPVVTVDAPARPVMARADRARLTRVLQNIVGNAVKYGSRAALLQPIQVTVAEEGRHALISVRDRGVGIPADELPRIFTRFYRGSTAAGTKGSGIGLFGSKAIVEQHGGDISVDSAVGQGTTVTVRLPHTDPSMADQSSLKKP